jgi:hypothetical protein
VAQWDHETTQNNQHLCGGSTLGLFWAIFLQNFCLGSYVLCFKDRPRKNLDDEKWLQKFKESISFSTIDFYLMPNVHSTHFNH